MSRSISVVLALLAGVLVALLILRVAKPGPGSGAFTEVDAEALSSLAVEAVAQACRGATFDESGASEPRQVADGVIIRVIPNSKGNQNKLEQLQRGRILAKIQNLGDQDYLPLAVSARGESCWAVRHDDERNMLISKFVSLTNSNQAEDQNFHIDIHPNPHPRSYAEWRQIVAATPAPGASNLRLASFMPDLQDTALASDPWMWVSCLSNGCCRSRQ